MASSSLVDDTAVALTDEEEALSYAWALYWRPPDEEVLLANNIRGSRANISAGAVEVFSPSFYQLNYLDEFAAYSVAYIQIASESYQSFAPLPDLGPQFVYVSSQAGYAALISQDLVVSSQAGYAALISQDLVVSSQTAYIVLLDKRTKNYSQAIMGTF